MANNRDGWSSGQVTGRVDRIVEEEGNDGARRTSIILITDNGKERRVGTFRTYEGPLPKVGERICIETRISPPSNPKYKTGFHYVEDWHPLDRPSGGTTEPATPLPEESGTPRELPGEGILAAELRRLTGAVCLLIAVTGDVSDEHIQRANLYKQIADGIE